MFRPSTGEDGALQILVVRPFHAGGAAGALRFALLDSVWRSGKNKEYLWPRAQLPAHCASRIRVRLLMPTKQLENDAEGFAASSLSPTFTLSAHDPSALYEVPAKCICDVKFGRSYLSLTLTREAIKGWKSAAKAAVPFEPSKKANPLDKVFFTEDDFQRNATGRSNMQRYVAHMIHDYESMFSKIVNSKGEIQLTPEKKIS